MEGSRELLTESGEDDDFADAIKILAKYHNMELINLLVNKYPDLKIYRTEALIRSNQLQQIDKTIPGSYWETRSFGKAVAKSRDIYTFFHFNGLCPKNKLAFFNTQILKYTDSNNPIFPYIIETYEGKDLSILETKGNDPYGFLQLYSKLPPDSRVGVKNLTLPPETERIAQGIYKNIYFKNE